MQQFAIEGIQEIIIYPHTGEKVNFLRSSNDRVGHIIAKGKTAKEAWQAVQTAYKKMDVIVK